MDQIKILMDTQLSERELMIFLLVENGMSYRELAKHLLTNHTNIRRAHEAAKEKINKFAEAGLFSTPVEPSK